MPSTTLPAEFASALLNWYDAHARVLPWRSHPTAYRVWISEIMLQQTRVEAVKPYFERFIAALPDVRALAEAPEEQLLKLWEGLGYYRRVRYLQAAAQIILREYGGDLPATADAWEKLPGIGAYTAGAIASIALGEAVPAVDGNVLRVIARVLNDHRDVMLPPVRMAFTEALRARIPAARAGDFTQSVMELGATVCLPNGAPRCEACPLREFCAGFFAGEAASLPVKTAPRPRRREDKTVFLLRHGDKVALRRRPERGLLAGLWEFPHTENSLSECEVTDKWHILEPSSVHMIGAYQHVFTHLEWHLNVWELVCLHECEDFTWVDTSFLQSELALPSLWKPVLHYLTGRRGRANNILGL